MVMDARRRILLNTPHIETASGGVANFKTDMIAPLKECKVNFLPKQSGNGDPSPTNIRPISGWDGLTVTRCGENLIDPNTLVRVDGYTISYSGTPNKDPTPANGYSDNFYRVKPSTTYTLLGSGTRVPIEYDINKNFVYRGGGQDPPRTFITDANTAYLRIQYRLSDLNVSTWQLVEGRTVPSAYIQPDFDYFPISWTQQGTVYGGYVDLVSGELVAEWAYTDLGEVTYSKIDRSEFYYFQALRCLIDGKLIYNSYTSTIKCEKYKTVRATDIYGGICGNFAISMYDTIPPGLRIRDDSYSTPEALQAALNGTMVYYELETPQLIATLTPQQIKAVKGINNIYSDADSAEVKFWTH